MMNTRLFYLVVTVCSLVLLALLRFFAGSWILGMFAAFALAAVALLAGLAALVSWVLSRLRPSKVVHSATRWCRQAFLLSIALTVTAIAGMFVIEERHPAQGDEVVSLIEKYREQVGKYPCSEADLVPDYVPKWSYTCFLHGCSIPFMGRLDGENAFHLTCMGMPRWIYDSTTKRWAAWWH